MLVIPLFIVFAGMRSPALLPCIRSMHCLCGVGQQVPQLKRVYQIRVPTLLYVAVLVPYQASVSQSNVTKGRDELVYLPRSWTFKQAR